MTTHHTLPGIAPDSRWEWMTDLRGDSLPPNPEPLSPPASPCGRPLAQIPRRARGRRTIYAQDLEAQLRATKERLTELDEMQILDPQDCVEITRLRRLELKLVSELIRIRS